MVNNFAASFSFPSFELQNLHAYIRQLKIITTIITFLNRLFLVEMINQTFRAKSLIKVIDSHALSFAFLKSTR